jgi:esterase/lipase superfamily enzyme
MMLRSLLSVLRPALSLVVLLSICVSMAPASSHAQDAATKRWALIERVDIDPRAGRKEVVFVNPTQRSLALRLIARKGDLDLSRIAVTYGNGQVHFEKRLIHLVETDRTKPINPTTVPQIPVAVSLVYEPQDQVAQIIIEIWSLEAPPDTIFERRLDVAGSPLSDFTEVLIHFATIRQRDANLMKDRRTLATFNGEVGDALLFGEALVTVPTNRKAGTIPRPLKDYYVWSFEYRKEDPKRDFTLAAVEVTSVDAFTDSMARVTQEAKAFAGHAFVFVHGYNVRFDDALFRAAQLAHDIEFDGPVVAYSWPSRGSMFDYKHDADMVKVSRDGLLETLQRVAATPGITRVNLVAHSLGSEPVLEALGMHRKIARSGGAAQDLKLNEIIFAASDVTRPYFVQQVTLLRPLAKGVTLYASSNDLALKASKKFSRSLERAGDVSADGPLVTPGVESIDISKAATSVFALNHSLFAERKALVEDLRQLLRSTRPPHERSKLFEPIGATTKQYWRFVGEE